MQRIKYTLALAVSILILHLSGCKSDDPSASSPEQLQVDKLTGQWKAAGESFVSLDNRDASEYFQGFTLVFDSQKNFTTTNGNAPIWPESGTYEFVESNGSTNVNQLIRNDDNVMNIIELTESSLKLEFYYDSSTPGGRSMSVSGKYYFELVSL